MGLKFIYFRTIRFLIYKGDIFACFKSTAAK